MFTDQNKKQNAVITACAVDATVKTMLKLQGGYIGKIDLEEVAEIAAQEIQNEVINRRQHNVK